MNSRHYFAFGIAVISLTCGFPEGGAQGVDSNLTTEPMSDSQGNDGVRVYHFQASEAASTNSSLEYTSAVPEIPAVTLCLWVKFRHFGSVLDSLVSYFTVGNDDLKIMYKWLNKEIIFFVRAYRIVVKITLPLFTWIHFHVSADFIKATHHVLVNDREVEVVVETTDENLVGKPVNAGGTLVLGQEQDTALGGYSVTQAFSGDIAEFYMFLNMLTKETDAKFNCFRHDFGDNKPAIALDTSDWKVVGDVTSSIMSKSLLDPAKKDLFYVLPERKIFEKAEKLCRTLGFPVALPKNDEENDILFEEALTFESICITSYSTNIWIAPFANMSAQEWQNVNTKEPLTYDNFAERYRFLLSSRRCSSMGSSFYPKLWYHTACSHYDPCPACQNSPVNSIQIRGLCEASQFDREVRINGKVNLKPVFHGTHYTKMWWDNTTWVMVSRLMPELQAKMIMQNEDDYPVGRNQWRISGDECPSQELELLLTVCGEESFPCNDGTCVLMSQRCDLRAHCDDGSDEIGCDKVFIGGDYEKTLPPPPPEGEDVVNVTLSVVITAVRKLNLMNQAVTLDVQLLAEWEDSRLNYADLQPDQYRNQIQDTDRLWLTRLAITDDTGSLADLANRGSSVLVVQVSEPLPDKDTMATKAVVYPGSGNPLQLSQELSVTFQCQFNLQWFPFDNQRCSLNFRLGEVESKLVRLTANEAQYIGPKKLTEYEVRTVTMKVIVDENGQKLTVVFTNLFLYYLANSYLPSFLLVVISYSTFYFRLEDFNERIMVSITAMLVLVALFQQTSSTILKTTYLKLIDVWYMVCIVVDFVMVILLVVIDFIRHQSEDTVKVFPANGRPQDTFHEKKSARKYNAVIMVLLPVVFIIFLVIYGSVAAVEYITGQNGST